MLTGDWSLVIMRGIVTSGHCLGVGLLRHLRLRPKTIADWLDKLPERDTRLQTNIGTNIPTDRPKVNSAHLE